MFPEIEEIKRKRKKLGISQKRLAELVGVSQPLIARIESGTLDPKLSLIKRIYRVLEEIEGKSLDARKIMKSPVISVQADEPVKRAAEIMIDNEISQMPVLEGDRMVGSVTENSIVKALINRGVEAEELKVRDVMEEPFPAVDPEESVRPILSLLLESQAVVVMEEGKVKGIITKQDVMKYMTALK
jgi:predicted transcriptional regulator